MSLGHAADPRAMAASGLLASSVLSMETPAPKFIYDVSAFRIRNPRDRSQHRRLVSNAGKLARRGAREGARRRFDLETELFGAAAALQAEADQIEAFLADPLWRDRIENLVTTAGKNNVIEVYFRSTSKAAGWYAGLKGSGSAAAGDTSASHAGWSEVTAFSETARQALTLAAAASGSANNSASKAVHSINGTATVAGAFVIDNSTKGGTTGTLYSAADFTAARSVQSGDSLSVTITLSF